jgi:hypothetical protein
MIVGTGVAAEAVEADLTEQRVANNPAITLREDSR